MVVENKIQLLISLMTHFIYNTYTLMLLHDLTINEFINFNYNVKSTHYANRRSHAIYTYTLMLFYCCIYINAYLCHYTRRRNKLYNTVF